MAMKTVFLPPPQTNDMLVVAEYNRHLDQERTERRRRMPGEIARTSVLFAVIVCVFAAGGWGGFRIAVGIGERIVERRAAEKRLKDLRLAAAQQEAIRRDLAARAATARAEAERVASEKAKMQRAAAAAAADGR